MLRGYLLTESGEGEGYSRKIIMVDPETREHKSMSILGLVLFLAETNTGLPKLYAFQTLQIILRNPLQGVSIEETQALKSLLLRHLENPLK